MLSSPVEEQKRKHERSVAILKQQSDVEARNGKDLVSRELRVSCHKRSGREPPPRTCW